MQVIFRGAYWLRFWAQLQRDEQSKDTLVVMSKKLEMIALEITIEGVSIFYVCFRSLVYVKDYRLAVYFFELCIIWLGTSSDVEAGFYYPLSKKIYISR